MKKFIASITAIAALTIIGITGAASAQGAVAQGAERVGDAAGDLAEGAGGAAGNAAEGVGDAIGDLIDPDSNNHQNDILDKDGDGHVEDGTKASGSVAAATDNMTTPTPTASETTLATSSGDTAGKNQEDIKTSQGNMSNTDSNPSTGTVETVIFGTLALSSLALAAGSRKRR